MFLWALYATALIQLLATPVLGITLLLLVVERVAGIGIFDPKLGGDPVLFQHFFWFYSHPAVYIMILPGMGIISELFSVFSRKHIFGYKFIAYSGVAIALVGFLVWGHHMFVSGQSALAGMIFSAMTFGVAIPSAIKMFNWLSTLYKGSIWLATPMCYALSFIFLFGIGGLTGLFLGALSVNVHVHDTYFVVAHFHYVMVGGTVIAFLGGLHYWWPKITGRMYHDGWGRLACAARVRRLQPDVLPAVPPGHARHAPPLLRLYRLGQEPSGVHHLQRAVVAGGLPAGRGTRAGARLPAGLAVCRPPGAGQSLGRRHAGVAVQLAAAVRQFSRSAAGGRSLRFQPDQVRSRIKGYLTPGADATCTSARSAL